METPGQFSAEINNNSSLSSTFHWTSLPFQALLSLLNRDPNDGRSPSARGAIGALGGGSGN
jgi:hypothetical protein